MPHLIQARKALLEDAAHTVPCVVEGIDGSEVSLTTIRGDPVAATVARPAAFADALGRVDLTRLDGRPLALVSQRYGLLAVAFGPAAPPRRLEVVVAVDLGTDPLEIPADADAGQPGWLLFDLAAAGSADES